MLDDDMEITMEKLNKHMAGKEDELLETIRKRTKEVANIAEHTDDDSEHVGELAVIEARDNTLLYSLGMSKKLLGAATNIQSGLVVAAVMTDKTNLDTLNALFLLSYLRGFAKAKEIFGKATSESKPEAKPEKPSHNTNGKVSGSVMDLKLS